MSVTLIDVIASSLSEKHPNVEITHLGDGSGSCIEIKKRKEGKEYVFCLEFSHDGHELQDVTLFVGDVIEKIDHNKVV